MFNPEIKKETLRFEKRRDSVFDSSKSLSVGAGYLDPVPMLLERRQLIGTGCLGNRTPRTEGTTGRFAQRRRYVALQYNPFLPGNFLGIG